MASNVDRFDLFLSYNQKSSKAVLERVNQELKNAGYKTWIDFEQMKPGDVLNEKMAEGILFSTAVLCFITKDYCESRSCVNELQFAENKRKPSIYILLESLNRPEYEANTKIAAIQLAINTKIQLYAFKPPKTFSPWSKELFQELVSSIESFVRPQWNKTAGNTIRFESVDYKLEGIRNQYASLFK